MKNQELMFSVAMSVYKNDKPEYLDIALNSICTQSLMPSEIYLVIDGAIGAELSSVIKDYSSRYPIFTINQLPENKGLGNALNIAVKNAKYELIARMDSDDICAPGRFKKQIEAFRNNPDVDIIGGWVLGFDTDLESGDVSAGKKKLTNEEIYRQLPKRSPMSHVTVMYKRAAVLKAGNYLDLYYHEDYYLWSRMMKAGCVFMNIPEYLVYVRFGREQAKRHGGRKYFNAEYTLRKFMLKNRLCTKFEFYKQVLIRFVYQMVLTPSLRNYVALKFNRKHITNDEVKRIMLTNIENDRMSIDVE